MTAAPPARTPAADPGDDLRLARIHLRMGQLTLARAELEDLLARDALDPTGLAVLAEARWRTGDTDGANLAAEAHLEAGGSDAIAICIAAEAAAADGRPGDARVLMDRLPEADAATLDALFAGMPRRAFWPAGPVDRTELDEIRRETEARGGVRAGGMSEAPTQAYRREELGGAMPGGSPGRLAAQGAGTAGPAGGAGLGQGLGGRSPAGGSTRSLPGPRDVIDATSGWDGLAGHAAGRAGARRRGDPTASQAAGRHAKAQLDPLAELARARDELDTKPDKALLRLALVLRADPTLAPAVLDAIHLRREPAAAVLRGDAERLLGRHLEAEAAFDAAAESLEA